jgi:hypothetical protein
MSIHNRGPKANPAPHLPTMRDQLTVAVVHVARTYGLPWPQAKQVVKQIAALMLDELKEQKHVHHQDDEI